VEKDMTTDTRATQQTTVIPSPLRERFRELAFKASQGDREAEAELLQLEAKLADAERMARRTEAAGIEANRLAAQAEQKAAADAMAAAVRSYTKTLKARAVAYARIQQLTDDLVSAVRQALEIGGETRTAALRLGYSPGLLPSSEISSYLFWRLGRDGAGSAGLTDMPPVFPALRQQLIKE
jgi:hypothetical protein